MSSDDSPTQSGGYRHQDGQAVFTPREGVQPHPQTRLSQRVDDRSDEDVRVIWAEAQPVAYSGAGAEAYARYHDDTDLVLIAEFGFIVTVLELDNEPDDVQQNVRQQVKS